MVFWQQFLVTLIILQVSVFLTTIYLHRYLTHRAIDLNPALANLMHLFLSLSTGIIPREWVAVHRKHHHFSDKEGDPHSPYIHGLLKVFFLNMWYYNKEKASKETVSQYTSDYKPDLVDRIPHVVLKRAVYGGLVLSILAFGSWQGPVLWAIHGLTYILLNSGVNSFCHRIGYRNFHAEANLATNFILWALMSGGEGLHNNHHAVQNSAKFSVKWWEVDLGWGGILILKQLHLARVIKAKAHVGGE